MNMEAVPCVFKGKDEGGKETTMIGLIIRPTGQVRFLGVFKCLAKNV
jgi:hypothetical protein